MHSASSRRRFVRPEQAVLRVGRRGRRVVGRRRAGRSRDSTIRRTSVLTDQPSSTNRTARSSSSSGCDGRLAGRAEVVGGADEPGAEQPVPGAVDDHAGRQRVVARRRASRPARAGRSRPLGIAGGVADGRHLQEPARAPARRGCGRCRGRGPACPRSSPPRRPTSPSSPLRAARPAAASARPPAPRAASPSPAFARRAGFAASASGRPRRPGGTDGVGDDVPVRPLVGDQHVALAVLLEAVLAQRDEPPVDRRGSASCRP